MNDNKFDELIQQFRKLFGLSYKKTEQKLISLIYNEYLIQEIINGLGDVKAYLGICPICSGVMLDHKCVFCSDKSRDQTVLCVVENYSNALKIAKTNTYKGMFHILTGLFSVKQKSERVETSLKNMIKRIKDTPELSELIIATPATIEGELTARIIKKEIESLKNPFKITMLAKGIPLGGSLDYVDEYTLKTSLKNRR